MPAVSQAQQRLFAMVAAYKKGKLKSASPKIQDVAQHVSMNSAEDFARTRRKGLAQSLAK